jgi:hypothetical protein
MLFASFIDVKLPCHAQFDGEAGYCWTFGRTTASVGLHVE